jgi:hypothetical protein
MSNVINVVRDGTGFMVKTLPMILAIGYSTIR